MRTHSWTGLLELVAAYTIYIQGYNLVVHACACMHAITGKRQVVPLLSLVLLRFVKSSRLGQDHHYQGVIYYTPNK
jgi:hypothetical protein